MNNTTIELIDERIELLVQWREIEDEDVQFLMTNK